MRSMASKSSPITSTWESYYHAPIREPYPSPRTIPYGFLNERGRIHIAEDLIEHEYGLPKSRRNDQNRYLRICDSEVEGFRRDDRGFTGLTTRADHYPLRFVAEKLNLIVKWLKLEDCLGEKTRDPP